VTTELQLPSETSARELYFRIANSDLLLCTDLIPGFDLTTYQFQKTYSQGGDKIYCEDIDGGASWGVRLGDASRNPVIPLKPGRTINKVFRSFTLFSTQPAPSFSSPGGNGDLQATSIELYISTGAQMIVDSPRDWGKGFGSRSVGRTDCVATTVPRLVLEDFNKPGGFPNNANITQWKPGRRGATLLIRNSDVANTLFLAQQSSQVLSPSLITEMYRLFPGESLTMELDGSIQQSFNQLLINGTPDVGMVLYTKAGTCNYDWMISRLSCDSAPIKPQENLGVNLG
jgi:hypothetical protein